MKFYKISPHNLRDLAIFKNTSLKIGVLGGSFNPPHEGHIYVSNMAKTRYNLDIIIWLITPFNYFKQAKDFIPFKERFLLCVNLVTHLKFIIPLKFENSYNLYYSYRIFNELQSLLGKNNQLFWILGSDILINLHLFKKWHEILKNHKLIVINRQNNLPKSQYKVATMYKKNLQIDIIYDTIISKDIFNTSTIILCRNKQLDISSTKIRKTLQLYIGK